MLNAATHVFAMTEGHLAVLESRFPADADKFFLVREFSGISDKRQGIDVPDPIGMGLPPMRKSPKCSMPQSRRSSPTWIQSPDKQPPRCELCCKSASTPPGLPRKSKLLP